MPFRLKGMTITPTTTVPDRATTLDPDLLERFHQRAAEHDRTGTFPVDDVAELRAVGWLGAAAPVGAGGLGLDVVALGLEQRRMAQVAPATALSTCMHHYWVGVGATLSAFGLPMGDRILGWVADGDVLASGHAEVGNDVPIALSTTRADRAPGGWRFSGRKLFGSLGPVWDRLGIHAMDATAPDGPVVVHAFVSRTAPGVDVVETWDAHGMRATESHDTVLDGVFVPDDDVVCVVPAGPPTDIALGAMFVWAGSLISNVYLGIAERALELAIREASTKRSIGLEGRTLAHNPMLQHHVAEMHLELDAARKVIDRLTGDWVAGVDHGPGWALEVFGAKWRASTAAMRVVDLACEVAGGGSFRRGSELERLSRDVRAARFHPPTDGYVHEVVGKTLLGIDPAGPRW